MKLLLICDDSYHKGEIVIEGLNFLTKLNEIDVIRDSSNISIHLFKNYDIIILSKANDKKWLTKEFERGFEQYVKSGGSILVIHSGTANFLRNTMYRQLIGGVFTHHPEPCNVIFKPTIDNSITKSVQAFEEKDEHYFIQLEEDSTVFLQTISYHGKQPGGWMKTYGKGKVCVLTPGHFLSVFYNANFKKLILNTIEWLSKKAVIE